ncbi:MAG: phosphomannomutase/phosphoglucomutase [Firmicutes bacterium]|nr:phosphomannomutase/phosphoglucomutase [Bacillota bacterium]
MNNGIDHVFRQYDIRGVVGAQLDSDFVYRLGRSIGTYCLDRGARTLSLGRDARLSSPGFRDAMAQGLLECGCDVIDIGMVPTPLLYFSLFSLPVDGGVMITGSHNPKDQNGFKVCVGKSTIYGDEIQRIKEIWKSGTYAAGSGVLSQRDISEEYIDHVASQISKGNRDVRVVVDAGNGVGGVVGVPLYRKLGFDVVELFCTPDGNFPNHHPDPTVVESLEWLTKTVKENGADLGIAFDGDADRIGCVTADGTVLWGDQMMILFARDILKRMPGAKFVAEVKCSQSLFDDIEKHGGVPIMWKVGHSLIKAKMKDEGAVLAGEMSGHMFFADRYFGYDDAIYAGARLLELVSNSDADLEQIMSSLPRMYNTPEIRVDYPDDLKFSAVDKVIEAFRDRYEVIDIDGARVRFPDGWALVRASNTQPALVMRFEGESREAVERLQSEIGRELERIKSRA